MDSLTSHFSTLEEMVVHGGASLDSDDLRQILSSCPNLHTLDAIDDGYYLDIDNYRVEMYAEQFVDLDPMTGAPSPWPCEKSLRVLKVVVANVSHNPKCYHSATQSQVYRRLARFENLETLWMGHQPYMTGDTQQVAYQKDNCLHFLWRVDWTFSKD